MKKAVMVIMLLGLFAVVAGAAISNDDKDFRAGLKSYNSKNYKAAVKQFKEYINNKPDPTAYYLIGYSLYKLGKFSEADDYFRDAYFIDPEFSLEKVDLIKKVSDESEKPVQAASAEQKTKAPQPPAPVVVQKPVTPAQSAPKQVESSTPPQTVPTLPAPDAAPAFPPMQMPEAAGPAALIAMVAAFGMILLLIGIAVYVYYSLCLFLIAKKLNVPAPWTAWIPIVQMWTFVVSAGKPGWWVLLFLVPLVNFFVGIYLWMCVTENLGKNKWLGLLILVPLAGIIYPGWLAFSRTEGSGR